MVWRPWLSQGKHFPTSLESRVLSLSLELVQEQWSPLEWATLKIRGMPMLTVNAGLYPVPSDLLTSVVSFHAGML